jgi:hypothetical protein
MMQTSIASSVATYHEENPMKMRWKAALCLMAVVGVLQAQTPAVAPQRGGAALRQPAQIAPYDFNEHQGWRQMFDGSTLKGWDGPMDVWHVEEGAITAKDPEGSVYLFWGGGMLKNFEFKTEMKLEGEGANTGIQFRAIRLGPVPGKKNSEWESRGYQADFTYTNSASGTLIECCNGPRRGVPPRSDRAPRGQMVRAAASEGEKPTVVANLGDPNELKIYIKVGDWNQIHIVARGSTLMYLINGHLMSVFLDDNPKMFGDHGELAVQLEGQGNGRKVSFRNMWLKTLP